MDNLPSQLETQAAKLEEELRDMMFAEKLLNYESGKVLIKWLQARCNIYINQLTSEKFVKDHTGYVQAQARLKENQYLIRKINASSHGGIKAKLENKLSELNEQIDMEKVIDG